MQYFNKRTNTMVEMSEQQYSLLSTANRADIAAPPKELIVPELLCAEIKKVADAAPIEVVVPQEVPQPTKNKGGRPPKNKNNDNNN